MRWTCDIPRVIKARRRESTAPAERSGVFLFLWRGHKFAKLQVEGGKILQESLGEVLTLAIIMHIMIMKKYTEKGM